MFTPQWISNLGLEDPSISEYIHLPDLRQVATFFLGILFATSAYYLVNSPTLASIVSRLVRRRTSGPTEGSIHDLESKSTLTSIRRDPASLVFILNVVYITTTATQFASLLTFSSSKGAVPCAFFVVWACLGTETVRLIGLLKLSLHLHELQKSGWERLVLWGTLTLLAAVMFLSTAVSTGVLRQIPQNQSLSLCYIRHFTLGAAVMAGMSLLMELYILARFLFLTIPWLFGLDSSVKLSRDVRILQVSSLIVLDAATVYPSLFPTLLIADFVPFSVASILVLTAFNYNPTPKQFLVSSILQAGPGSIPHSTRISTPNFSPFLNMQSSVVSSKEISIVELPADDASIRSTRVSHPSRSYRHPFAAVAFSESPISADPHSLPIGQSSSSNGAPKPTSGAHGTPLASFNENVVKKRMNAYEALQKDTKGKRQRSFLPALGTSEPSPNGASSVKPDLFRVPDPRNPGQILPKQREVADHMTAGPRNAHQTHQVVGSLASIKSQDTPPLTPPPAPPRAPRTARQPYPPILILAHDIHEPLMAKPSSPDSAKIFGSDILRSREHVVGTLTTPRRRSSENGEQAEADRGTPERELKTSRSSLSMHRPPSSHHSVITGTGDPQSPRTGESARPTTVGSAQTRGDAESLAIVHEGLPSTTWSSSGEESSSKAATNGLKRPTFGEGSFDRFRSGINASKEIAPSPRGHDPEVPPSPDTQSAPEARSGVGVRLGARRRSGINSDKAREQSEKSSGS